MSTLSKLPRQAIPLSEKTQQWRKNTVQAIIDMSEFSDTTGSVNSLHLSDTVPFSSGALGHRRMKKKAYLYYNGILDESDYTHVLKPYGQTRVTDANGNQVDRKFPSRLHNYNIIEPLVNLLLGEYDKRPMSFTVTVANQDVINRKGKAVKQALIENLQQQFINLLAQSGVPIDESMIQEVQSPEELEEYMNTTYRDDRANIGQKSLEYLMYHQDIKRQFQKGFFHWLVSGEVFSKREVFHNEVEYQILNPLFVDYDKSPDNDFIEDGEWAIELRLMYPADIIDHFYDVLTKEEIEKISNVSSGEAFPDGTASIIDENTIDDRSRTLPNLQSVFFVYWKSQKKVGIRSYFDEFGFEQEEIIDENYSGDRQGIKWFWVNEVWRGVKIGDSIFKNIEPIEVQRTSINNKSGCKLPINGRRYSDINSPNVSFVMKLVPYQLIYNIYKFRLNNAVAKAKDMIAQLDINMIPKGWDVDTWMYYVDAFGISWTDYAREGIVLNPQHQTVLDLTAKSINAYIDLLAYTMQEVQELTGITRQRKGQFTQFDLKGVSEQSLIQSSAITEKIFNDYSQFEQKDLQALMDYSKYAWIEGKSTSFVMPDGTVEFLEVDGFEHATLEYGIRVNINSKEIQELNELKQLAIPMVQNGAPASVVMEIFDAKNISGLKQKILEAEQAQAQLMQSQQEAQMQQIQQQAQMEELKLQQEREIASENNQTKITVAQIAAQAQMARNQGGDQDANDNGILDANEMLIKRVDSAEKMALENKKLKLQKEMHDQDLKQDMTKHKDKMKLDARKITIQAQKPKVSSSRK